MKDEKQQGEMPNPTALPARLHQIILIRNIP